MRVLISSVSILSARDLLGVASLLHSLGSCDKTREVSYDFCLVVGHIEKVRVSGVDQLSRDELKKNIQALVDVIRRRYLVRLFSILS